MEVPDAVRQAGLFRQLYLQDPPVGHSTRRAPVDGVLVVLPLRWRWRW
jgi:hypothetical protein